MKLTQKIVIIGGMGPQASLELHRRFLNKAADMGAREGNEYPAITHISVPVPDFITNKRNSSKAYAMLSGVLAGMEMDPCTQVVIACNTAHLLLPRLQQSINHKIVSLVDLVVDELHASNAKKVGLVATPTTIRAGLYSKPLSRDGIKLVEPTSREQQYLEITIRNIIANKPLESQQDAMTKIVNRMLSLGCDSVILGCTELSYLNARNIPNAVDPMDLAVNEILKANTMTELGYNDVNE